jgi:peptidoglycan/LPS O-acetylase OafA/YrhL
MPELDSLRGLAILGVLLLHGFSWQYGWADFGGIVRLWLQITQQGGLGVNLFFVLSGFLITGILLEAKTKPQYYRRFYTRRALRILPAYYALLLLLLVLGSASAAFVGLSFIYLANLTNFFGVACDYGPLWSLAVEEHFYIFWPTAVRRFTPRQLAFFSLGIVVLVPILRAFSFRIGWTEGLAWYTWFVADGLAMGSFLAVVLRTAITRNQVARLCGFLIGGAVVLGAVGQPFGILTRNRGLGAGLQYTLVHAFFSGVLLLFLLLGTSSRKTWVNYGWLRFLGYISYGLYLIHLLVFRLYDRLGRHYWPALVPGRGDFGLIVFRFFVAGAVAIIAAFVSRRYLEERFLRLKDRMVPVPLESTSVSVIAPNPAEEMR